MKVGCHVSISGGVDKAVQNALERECTSFQIFTRNPRGWRAKKLESDEISRYKSSLEDSEIKSSDTCAHMPYLPNLASTKPEGHAKSTDTLADEVDRCGRLGIPYLVTHLGSHLGAGREAGIGQLAKAYARAADVDNDVVILLENTAGQKNSVGSEFAELGKILSKLKPRKRFGVCIDTCHLFAAGYDLRSQKTVRETFSKFDEEVGYENLKILHLNDSKGGLGSNLDRHYHIGLGSIGRDGMRAIVQLISKKSIPIILETPADETRDDLENIRTVRDMAQ